MQNKLVKKLVLAGVVSFGSFLNAAHVVSTPAMPVKGDIKNNVSIHSNIGVVDSTRVIASEVSQPFQAQVANIQQEHQDLIAGMDADLEKKHKNLQAKAKVADVTALQKDQDELNEAKGKRDLAAKSATEKIQRAANKAMEDFGKLVQQAAEKLRAELGLDVVLEKNALLAFAPATDVTDKLIEIIKTMQKTSASAKANTAKPVSPVKK